MADGVASMAAALVCWSSRRPYVETLAIADESATSQTSV
jgi:hypothetical protein